MMSVLVSVLRSGRILCRNYCTVVNNATVCNFFFSTFELRASIEACKYHC